MSLLLVTAAACTALPPTTPAPAGSATGAPAGQPTVAPPATAPAVTAGVPADCPPATEGLQRLIHFEHGYCLTYPAQYKVEQPGAAETLLVIGGLLNAGDPRVHIQVGPAEGRTAQSVADQMESEYEDFDIVRSEAQVAGQPAVVLDKLPGQDINRRVFLVANDRLYQFYFSPADPAVETFAGMESLYMDILSSFTLLPADVQAPENAAALDCLTATADTQLLVDEGRGFCLLYPAGYDVVQPVDISETDLGEVVLYAGSIQDVSRPKVFIRVADAEGRTAQQVADAAVAEVEQNVPGHQVDRPFGVTVGYEIAERLDNMPGQDISRQVIAVHGGKVYTLIFVPADETQGDVYHQMEELYELVVRSMRFLN